MSRKDFSKQSEETLVLLEILGSKTRIQKDF